MVPRKLFSAIPFLLATAVLSCAGCGDIGQEPVAAENLSLNVVAAHSHGAANKPAHVHLAITSAKVLLKKITFVREQADDSVEIVAGPVVANIRLDGQTTTLVVTTIPPGLYDRVRFIVHKPEDSEPLPDPEFRTGASGGERYSVIVTGFYLDTPFTYRSRESARLEVEFSSPLVVPETGIVNMTLLVDPYLWFTDGDLVFDPFNESARIDDRIKRSFARAFRDDDRDGDPD
jgi:hypothetical protein